MGLFNLFKKKEAPKPAAEPVAPVKVIVWEDRKAFVSMDEKQEKQFKKWKKKVFLLILMIQSTMIFLFKWTE